jgi:hypothetical protein
MNPAADPRQQRDDLLQRCDEDWDALGIVDASTSMLEGEQPVAALRRSGRRKRSDEPVKVVTLMETDGVLHWEVGVPVRRSVYGRRGGRLGTAQFAGEPLRELKFAAIPPNQIGQFLQTIDDMLTPDQGLWAVSNAGKLVTRKPAQPVAKGRILLLIHGTFSNSQNVVESFQATAHGKAFLQSALGAYDQVLAWTHPTLSVSPLLNALDLGRHFANTEAQVDVICHSRGGLVCRYWREAFSPGIAGRSIFVGAPLAGTSLAAPHRLKEVINLISNISTEVARGAGVAGLVFPLASPFMTAAGALMKLLGSVTSVAAHTPLADAAVSLVPGLAAQSRVGNNAEIVRFRSAPLDSPDYFAVQADFEPPPVGWKFWSLFNVRRAGTAVANVAADAVFDTPNDLVVDTTAMVDLADELQIPSSRTLIFPADSGVHHVNYFDHQDTIDFFRQRLSRPGFQL